MRDQLGVTGIVITHDMRSAYTVGTRIAMLYEGRVRRVGTVDEMRNSTDPVVRQFVEGRAELALESTPATPPDGPDPRPRPCHTPRPRPRARCRRRCGAKHPTGPLFPAHSDSYDNCAFRRCLSRRGSRRGRGNCLRVAEETGLGGSSWWRTATIAGTSSFAAIDPQGVPLLPYADVAGGHAPQRAEGIRRSWRRSTRGAADLVRNARECSRRARRAHAESRGVPADHPAAVAPPRVSACTPARRARRRTAACGGCTTARPTRGWCAGAAAAIGRVLFARRPSISPFAVAPAGVSPSWTWPLTMYVGRVVRQRFHRFPSWRCCPRARGAPSLAARRRWVRGGVGRAWTTSARALM